MRRLALLCAVLAGCGTFDGRVARIAGVVDEAVRVPVAEQRFAGVVLVAREGRPLFRKAYGLADRERNVPHTPETPFMIMSVSKQFTAAPASSPSATSCPAWSPPDSTPRPRKCRT